MRALHLYISVLPAAVVGLFGLIAVFVLYTSDPTTQKARLVLVAAAVGAVITLGVAVLAADGATRRVRWQHAQPATRDQGDMRRWLSELASSSTRGRQELRELVGQLRGGETAAPRTEAYPTSDTGDPFVRLGFELRKAQCEAWNAVLAAASHKPAGSTDQRVDVFVNLARRMQSLSHRAIQSLDELENQVEDPDLLKGLFRVDHLSTRVRRQAESLAVIGGAASRRRWSRPVTVYEVLRSAIAEVEHYNRVKVVPPVDGTLHGGAVADVIHLLAELIENATKFAPPYTQVLIRVDRVTAGLAIEVEDRGLGIPSESRRRLNDLLTDPERVDTGELLQDGRIGLLVVSELARRHNLRVQLQGNLYGGSQAVVVVPNQLVSWEEAEAQRQAQAAPASAPASPSGSGYDIDTAPSAVRADHPAASVGVAGQQPALAREPQRLAASAQRSDPRSGMAADSGHGAGLPAPAPSAAAGPAPSGRAAETGERPPLPRRRAQANLAPELVNAPAPQEDDWEVEHNPGLMAAFQRGTRSGQESGDVTDGADSTNR